MDFPDPHSDPFYNTRCRRHTHAYPYTDTVRKLSIKGTGLAACLGILLFGLPPVEKVWAGNEIVTVPLILGDYYAWAYTEAFEDRAEAYGWTTAGVDALGWGIYFTSADEAGMKLVNIAGIAKTAYPIVTLLGASDSAVRERAWIALGTHTATLLTLEFLGRPALSINTSMGPRQDGLGMELAYRF